MDSSLDNNISEILSKYFNDSPLDHTIATDYYSLSRAILLKIPDILFNKRNLLQYVKKSEEDSIPEGKSESKPKLRRPPNAYFLFMAVFNEFVNKLANDESLDGKKRQMLGATFWKCLKDEYQAPYKRAAEDARKNFPRMTYGRWHSTRKTHLIHRKRRLSK
ncbi:4097_t:CDS:1 [Paraglomus occultum]|uniref:4097_t:CDS:1 n=1 Tax=Paraglomus occultum TaxID=144539 RepID=A0A9N8VZQ1_9GLOM|nr:4097_t:CDS:1 [Paraglomus occultum]